MKTALLQITSSDDPEENLEHVAELIAEAAGEGAGFILTPEVTNCVSTSRKHQSRVLCHEDEDKTLAGLRTAAKVFGVWLSIGSLALKTRDADGRFANRQFLIDPEGEIRARYDKIHMFDVSVTPEETYRESDGYRPGREAVVVQTGFANLGLSICYDLRFPNLYNALAHSGAEVLLVPSAFSPVTGRAHWQALLQARAIETGCWVLAAAQTGSHRARLGKPRETYGHSLAISPWGEIICEAGVDPTILYVELEMDQVAKARARVPSLLHETEFDGPGKL